MARVRPSALVAPLVGLALSAHAVTTGRGSLPVLGAPGPALCPEPGQGALPPEPQEAHLSDRQSAQDATAAVQEKFKAGDLAVHAFGHRFEKRSFTDVPSIEEQMQEWNRTGSFWAGAPLSQIRPEYRDHPLYGQLGYMVDWTQCDVRAAAAFDLGSDTGKMAGDWPSRMEELRRIRDRFRTPPPAPGKLEHRRITEFAYVVVPGNATDEMRSEYADLCMPAKSDATQFQGMQCLDGRDKNEAYSELKTRLLADVTSAYAGNTTKVGGNVYTEMLAACPLQALEGLVVSLRGIDHKMFHGGPSQDDARWEKLFGYERRELSTTSLRVDMFGESLSKALRTLPRPLVSGHKDYILPQLYSAARRWVDLFSSHVPGIMDKLPVFYYRPGVLDERPGWTQFADGLHDGHGLIVDERPWSDMTSPTSLTRLDGDPKD